MPLLRCFTSVSFPPTAHIRCVRLIRYSLFLPLPRSIFAGPHPGHFLGDRAVFRGRDGGSNFHRDGAIQPVDRAVPEPPPPAERDGGAARMPVTRGACPRRAPAGRAASMAVARVPVTRAPVAARAPGGGETGCLRRATKGRLPAGRGAHGKGMGGFSRGCGAAARAPRVKLSSEGHTPRRATVRRDGTSPRPRGRERSERGRPRERATGRAWAGRRAGAERTRGGGGQLRWMGGARDSLGDVRGTRSEMAQTRSEMCPGLARRGDPDSIRAGRGWRRRRRGRGGGNGGSRGRTLRLRRRGAARQGDAGWRGKGACRRRRA